MTFWPECGADKICISSLSNFPTHHESMYVRFGGIRNVKTWSEFIYEQTTLQARSSQM